MVTDVWGNSMQIEWGSVANSPGDFYPSKMTYADGAPDKTAASEVHFLYEKRPDVDALVQKCVNGPFHSVLGDREKIHKTYREFIVYDDDQVYPEYVVWYQRIYD